MQEELHFYLEAPGSSPGRALAGTVAQLVEHQTPFARVVSPTLVAASSNSTSRFRRSDPDGNWIARFELGAKALVAMSNKLRVSLPGAVTEPDSR